MTDLEEQATLLKKLAATAVNAAKARARGQPDALENLEAAVRLAGEFDWPEFAEQLRRSREQSRAQREASLQSRREKLLHAARAAGEPFDDGVRVVRVGVFRVEFDGESTVTSLGGVDVDRTKEADGEKLFKRLKDLRTGLEQNPFDRPRFFNQLKAAYGACRRAGAVDNFVPIRDLHREVVLERARAHDAFRKRPEPKNVPAYPMHRFVFDLARFIQQGTGFGEERLTTTTPSMRESTNAVFIPDLAHPLGNETPAARLAIVKQT